MSVGAGGVLPTAANWTGGMVCVGVPELKSINCSELVPCSAISAYCFTEFKAMALGAGFPPPLNATQGGKVPGKGFVGSEGEGQVADGVLFGFGVKVAKLGWMATLVAAVGNMGGVPCVVLLVTVTS